MNHTIIRQCKQSDAPHGAVFMYADSRSKIYRYKPWTRNPTRFHPNMPQFYQNNGISSTVTNGRIVNVLWEPTLAPIRNEWGEESP